MRRRPSFLTMWLVGVLREANPLRVRAILVAGTFTNRVVPCRLLGQKSNIDVFLCWTPRSSDIN